MMITNNGSVTAHTYSTTHSQSIDGVANEASSELAFVTLTLQGEEASRRTSIHPDRMDVEMAVPQISSRINLSELDIDNQGESKKRSLETTPSASADEEPAIFRPAKRRGAISSWTPSNAQMQGKKASEVLADELSDLCRINKYTPRH